MERIRLHEIALPEFQREYVWEVEQAQKLLKSPQGCIYVAVDDGGDLVGLAMGGPADAEKLPQTGAVYALYVSTRHQGQGLGRRLVWEVATDLAQKGMTALQIGCLAANAPARGFYAAIGGRLLDERLFDEEGVMLPEVIYEWADIQALATRG
jgi:ribosomal protein S18 acetylase RimI-like enzyme